MDLGLPLLAQRPLGAPGSEEVAMPRWMRKAARHPMTRDLIVAVVSVLAQHLGRRRLPRG